MGQIYDEIFIAKIDNQLTYLISDQPTTYSRYGRRMEILSNMLHTNAGWAVEGYLNPLFVSYVFFAEDEPEGDP